MCQRGWSGLAAAWGPSGECNTSRMCPGQLLCLILLLGQAAPTRAGHGLAPAACHREMWCRPSMGDRARRPLARSFVLPVSDANAASRCVWDGCRALPMVEAVPGQRKQVPPGIQSHVCGMPDWVAGPGSCLVSSWHSRPGAVPKSVQGSCCALPPHAGAGSRGSQLRHDLNGHQGLTLMFVDQCQSEW
jgi:hypothetical protein